jgi:hypothetical protein
MHNLKKTQHKIHDLLYLYIKYLFSQMKCTTKIISMRCILLYLFIGHLVNLILLIEYAQKKENQIISKGSIILKHLVISIFILYFFLIQILGFTNPTPLKNNLVLEISRKGMQPVWFRNQKFCFKFFLYLLVDDLENMDIYV